ncbi:hypothetical protein [Acidiferrobacter sp.]|uniref:hypothetical protein n=1 Tax=Acidiferrobacter sp. TaxID=1872107 RepID=UPI0026353032|nr:hypothetical protein [Acidiferrobacter sp.]
MAFDPRTHAPVRTLPRMIDAACYNRVALALARLGGPLNVEISVLRITIRVERRLWVARSLTDHMPVMAWLNFQVAGRGLHEAVPCEVRLYHFYGGLLMGHAPQLLVSRLDAWLARHHEDPDRRRRVVLAFTRCKDRQSPCGA